MVNNLWTKEEESILTDVYFDTITTKILSMLPGKKWHSVKKKAARMGLTRNIRYQMKKGVNHFFFNTWSYNMAYTLGFIAADGCIRKCGSAVVMRLSMKDYRHLVLINSLLSPERKIYIDNRNGCNMSVWSKYMCDKLKELGLHPQKTYSLRFPSIPDEYISSYIRGYFDGDGCIHKSKKNKNGTHTWSSIICGNEEFLNSMGNVLEDLAGMRKRCAKKESNSNIHTLRYSTYDSIKLANWMYKDNTICLERKYKKFQQLLTERSGMDNSANK